MKFGCCLNMLSSCANGVDSKMLAVFRQSGYDYVELPLSDMVRLSAKQLIAQQQALADTDMICRACNNFFPAEVRLTGDTADMVTIDNYVEHALDCAALLGAQIIVFGSGDAKRVPSGFDHANAYQQLVSLLQHIGQKAGERELTIVIEPLRVQECNIINTFEEGAQLVDDVGSPSVALLVDLYHLCCAQEPMEHIRALGPERLRHVHISNPDGRVFPCPDDHQASLYHDFFAALNAIEYNACVSIEAYTDNYSAIAAPSLQYLRDILCRTAHS